MIVELSPSQERKLHSILDRGMDTLNEINSKPSKFLSKLINKDKSIDSFDSEKSNSGTEITKKSFVINSELKSLQDKLSSLEARLSSKSESKPLKIQTKIPAQVLKMTAENTPRSTSNLSRKSIKSMKTIKKYKKEKVRHLEDVEKEIERIEKIERSITPNPTRFKVAKAKVENGRNSVVRNRVRDPSSLRRENDELRAEVERLEKVVAEQGRIKEEYENLIGAFEKSEKIRKKQKEVICKLKAELKTFI